MIAGADPGFQVREAHLKKLRRAEGGAKIVGVFRVKNHDFTPKNLIFFQFLGGGRAPGTPPPPPPPLDPLLHCVKNPIPGSLKGVKPLIKISGHV